MEIIVNYGSHMVKIVKSLVSVRFLIYFCKPWLLPPIARGTHQCIVVGIVGQAWWIPTAGSPTAGSPFAFFPKFQIPLYIAAVHIEGGKYQKRGAKIEIAPIEDLHLFMIHNGD